MKRKLSRNAVRVAVIAVFALASLPCSQIASAQTQSPSPSDANAASATADNAPMQPELPADVAPDSPLAQVILLAQSGVDESVLLSYVNNSAAPFNLTSDQIIYLKDIGVPDDVVSAMIERDQQLGARQLRRPHRQKQKRRRQQLK